MAPVKDSAVAETKSVLSAVLLADTFNEVSSPTSQVTYTCRTRFVCLPSGAIQIDNFQSC